MATLTATPTKAPRAHNGPHYANSYTEPARGSLTAVDPDRDKWQRLTWTLFFILVLGVFAVGVALSMSVNG